jgi:hypothetical protein
MRDRFITPEDYLTIDFSLKRDQYHTGMKPDFFFTPGSFCKVFEDDDGPIMFVRGVKALRIDIQFVDNRDFERNKAALAKENFDSFADNCRGAGFKELIFNTTSPLLKRYCKTVLGFNVVEGDELRFFL